MSRAERRMTAGMNSIPPTTRPARTSASLPSVSASSLAARPCPDATPVTTAISTTATRSWMTSTPKTYSRTAGAAGLWSNTLLTTIVLEMQTAAPRKTASVIGQSRNSPNERPHQNRKLIWRRAVRPEVGTTWMNFRTRNSSPMANITSRTPNSAMLSTRRGSAKRGIGRYGPTTSPASK